MTSHHHPGALAEVASLRSHFSVVLSLLRANPPGRLDPAQRLTRALLLDELERYAADGVFPLNRSFEARTPVFIDHVGTRCAMAHLMDVSGRGALALEVHERMNFATLPSIAEDPRVGAWLEAAGLTAEEAALIQPSYCGDSPSTCVCERAGDKNETAIVVLSQTSEGRAVVAEVVSNKLTDIPVAVGTEIRVDLSLPRAGITRIVRVERARGADAGTPELFARDVLVVLSGEDVVPCSTLGSSALPISKANALAAVRSADPQACQSYLASLDKEWTRTQAERDPQCGKMSGGVSTGPAPESTDDPWTSTPTNDASTGGCDLGGLGGSAPASLAILAAVVGAIAARRARR